MFKEQDVKKAVKDVSAKIMKFTGSKIATGQAYEILAAAHNFANWHVMSASMKTGKTTADTGDCYIERVNISHEVCFFTEDAVTSTVGEVLDSAPLLDFGLHAKIFLDISSTGSVEDIPRYASFNFTPELFDLIQKTQANLAKTGYQSIDVTLCYAIDWENNERHVVQSQKIVISEKGFYFSGYPRRDNCNLETNFVNINDLLKKIVKTKSEGKFYRYYVAAAISYIYQCIKGDLVELSRTAAINRNITETKT